MFTSLKRAVPKEQSTGRETLVSRRKIIETLQQLKADHVLLTIAVDGCSMFSNSAILSLEETRDLFYLDELSVPEAHQALLKHRKVKIQCRLQGMEMRFAALLRNASNDGGIALYEMDLPKSLVRVQRRDHFRLRLSGATVVPVNVPYFAGTSLRGEAFDLSVGGLGVLFKTREIPSRGQTLSHLSIGLPGQTLLRTDLEVRFAKRDNAHGMLRVGGRFLKLDLRQERQITRFLAEQQRRHRRHNPR